MDEEIVLSTFARETVMKGCIRSVTDLNDKKKERKIYALKRGVEDIILPKRGP